jgi:hypothetical protein
MRAIPAHLFVQLRAREHDHRVLDERLEQRKLARAQRDALAVAAQLARAEVHFEGAKTIRRPNLRRAGRGR